MRSILFRLVISLMETLTSRQQQFMVKLTQRHGDKLDLSTAYYEHFDWPVTVRCPLHGAFEMKPRHLMKHEQPCKTCRTMAREGKVVVYSSAHEVLPTSSALSLLNKVFQP